MTELLLVEDPAEELLVILLDSEDLLQLVGCQDFSAEEITVTKSVVK